MSNLIKKNAHLIKKMCYYLVKKKTIQNLDFTSEIAVTPVFICLLTEWKALAVSLITVMSIKDTQIR